MGWSHGVKSAPTKGLFFLSRHLIGGAKMQWWQVVWLELDLLVVSVLGLLLFFGYAKTNWLEVSCAT